MTRSSGLKAAAFAIAVLMIGSSVSLAVGDPTAASKFSPPGAAVCHVTEPDVNKVGPSLAGIVGRMSGSEARFDYSPALRTAAITWNENTLDRFIKNPAVAFTGPRCSLVSRVAMIVRMSRPISSAWHPEHSGAECVCPP
jgi:cytochrome c2